MPQAQFGTDNAMHIFTDGNIKRIRSEYGQSQGQRRPPTGLSTYKLARRWHTTPSNIGKIVTRETWAHV